MIFVNITIFYNNRMYKLFHNFFVLIVFLAISIGIQAQRKNTRYVEYIEKYKDVAVDHMKQYRIPASITLAQGLLESGAGGSELARKSNNHFGIKCGSSWTGRTVRHTDDAPNECFRAYRNASESYKDHSVFLTSGARYAFLFQLDIADYKAWARGLKKAGYATDPSYANRLITIIEDYDLYKYDKQGIYSKRQLRKNPWLLNPHQVYIANGLAYILARDGDTFKNLGKEFDISSRKLIGYNDLHKDYTLVDGDIIYLKAKKRKAAKPNTTYIVRDGDSMHTIAQKYAVKLKNLYKMNRKSADYIPEVGDVLRLR